MSSITSVCFARGIEATFKSHTSMRTTNDEEEFSECIHIIFDQTHLAHKHEQEILS